MRNEIIGDYDFELLASPRILQCRSNISTTSHALYVPLGAVVTLTHEGNPLLRCNSLSLGNFVPTSLALYINSAHGHLSLMRFASICLSPKASMAPDAIVLLSTSKNSRKFLRQTPPANRSNRSAIATVSNRLNSLAVNYAS